MGLDASAYKIKPEFMISPDQQTDLEFKPIPDEATSPLVEIAYWRKFHHLQGWMHRLYTAKGGKGEFNCNPVRLMPEDLLALEVAADVGLEATGGFFFGSSNWDEHYKNEVHEFCRLARQAIDDGYVVFYDSWW